MQMQRIAHAEHAESPRIPRKTAQHISMITMCKSVAVGSPYRLTATRTQDYLFEPAKYLTIHVRARNTHTQHTERLARTWKRTT